MTLNLIWGSICHHVTLKTTWDIIGQHIALEKHNWGDICQHIALKDNWRNTCQHVAETETVIWSLYVPQVVSECQALCIPISSLHISLKRGIRVAPDWSGPIPLCPRRQSSKRKSNLPRPGPGPGIQQWMSTHDSQTNLRQYMSSHNSKNQLRYHRSTPSSEKNNWGDICQHMQDTPIDLIKESLVKPRFTASIHISLKSEARVAPDWSRSIPWPQPSLANQCFLASLFGKYCSVILEYKLG